MEEIKDRNMSERLKKISQLSETFPEIGKWVQQQLLEGQEALTIYKKQPKQTASIRTRLLLYGSYCRTRRFFKQASRYL